MDNIVFGSEAREKIVSGSKTLADAVKVTLGPKGKNVAIIKKGKKPHLTKDGVTVANSIYLDDPFENLGAALVKEAAQRTADIAGDGTTTSTVLASTLIEVGNKLLGTGYDAKQIVYAFEACCTDIITELENSKLELNTQEQIESVATISANGEKEVGKLIAEAISKVGADGPITVEKSKQFDTSLTIVDGTVIDRGFLSPYFATNQTKTQAELENVLVMCYNASVETVHSILPYLEHAANNSKSILIIANDFSTDALQALVMNKLNGALKVCALKAPEFGNARTTALQDIATVTGGVVINQSVDGKIPFNEANLGFASKAVVDKGGTILIETKGEKEKIDAVKLEVSTLLKQPDIDSNEKSLLERRSRRLADGIAIIRVGGSTESEMIERKDRVDDALCAARAAKESGIHPGGGIALLKNSLKALENFENSIDEFKTEDYNISYKAFAKCCQEPLKQILKNAEEIPEIIIGAIRKSKTKNYGYNAADKKYGDMIKMNVIDPHKVVLYSIKHATSVACNVINLGCAVMVHDDIENHHGIVEVL